jgi:fatty-acyl-CoA synthase
VIFLGDPQWEQLMATGRAGNRELLIMRERELSADDAINIQYTSGTTGFPKGATLTHHNLLNNGFFVGEGCGYTEDDRVCIPVPYYHCFGMGMGNLGCTSHGATMIIPAPGFDPGRRISRASRR